MWLLLQLQSVGHDKNANNKLFNPYVQQSKEITRWDGVYKVLTTLTHIHGEGNVVGHSKR
jgi:hypothetical protein